MKSTCLLFVRGSWPRAPKTLNLVVGVSRVIQEEPLLTTPESVVMRWLESFGKVLVSRETKPVELDPPPPDVGMEGAGA